MVWQTATAGLEAATAACAALNLAYFFLRATTAHEPSASRRLAAFVLALLSLAALVESTLTLVIINLVTENGFASPPWFAARSLTFAGMACMSALVLRAVGR